MRKKQITSILIIGFIIRFILLIYQYNVGNLPQAGEDTVRLEQMAYWMYAGYDNRGFLDVINNGVALHSYIGSLIYDVFGRTPVLWSFFFLLLGLGTIYNIYRSVLLITNNNYKIANRSAWIACLFPNFAIFSVILLREVYFHFFLSLAVFYLLKYIKFKSIKNVILFILFALVGSLFHSAVFSVILGFIVYITLFNKKTSVIIKVFVLVASFGLLYYINMTGIGLDKFGGSFENATEAAMDGGGGIKEEAGSNYSSWLMLSGGPTDILLLPVRIIAFLFAPLIPFFVRSASHALGLIDALIYLLIFYNVYKNRFFHKKNEYSKALLTIVFTMSLAFSFGASNFGTNIRHRAKILPIVLIIPLFNKTENKILKRTYKMK